LPLVDLAREGRLPTSDLAAFAAHRLGCPSCEARYRRDERIGALVRAMPDAPLDELVVPRVWNRVLVGVAAGEAARTAGLRPWMRMSLVACAVVVSGTAIAAIALRHRAETKLAVEPRVTANATPSDEARVPEAPVPERVARAPELENVGPKSQQRATSPVPVPVPVPVPLAAPAARQTTASDTETVEYEAAIASYRSGNDADAAAQFHRFALAHPRSALLEDATFLEASSLARLGRADAAGAAAERHLALFPDSFHKRDAMSLVARSHPK
jgi:hypothetical protein